MVSGYAATEANAAKVAARHVPLDIKADVTLPHILFSNANQDAGWCVCRKPNKEQQNLRGSFLSVFPGVLKIESM
eukprot:SAG31_NODE_21132_length_557_cov_0.895197_2_plen_74_part_01